MNQPLRAGWMAASLLLVAVSMAVNAAEIDFPQRPPDTSPLEKMRTGQISVASSPKNIEVLEKEARWLAHRLPFPPYNGKEPEKASLDNLERLMEDVERRCTWSNPRLPPNEMQLEYARAFGRLMAKECMYVYDNSDSRLVRMNAARMFSIVGRLPDAALADDYLKIIRDKAYPDEVRLFAFEGLRNLLAIADPTFPAQHFIKSNPKLAEISKELENYITYKCAPGLPADQARVIQYIRREAVRALAQFKVGIVRQQTEALAKPATTLLRVATNDKYVKPADQALPGYGFHPLERIEAVIGLCSMLPDKGQNLELLVWMVNDALADIGAFQAKERTDFQKDPRNKPLVPWKITGVRLGDALAAWKKTAATLPPRQNPKVISDYVDIATKIVAKWEAEGVTAQPDYRTLDDWKRDKTRAPKSNEVVLDDPSTAVELSVAGKAELKEKK